MGDFEVLRLDYRLAVAARAGLVRLSFSAGGGEYLTRRINEASERVSETEAALTAFV
jgi:hypothetical protein